MKGLLIKDFFLTLANRRALIIIGIMSLFLAVAGNNETFIISYVSMFSSFLLLYTMACDEMSHSNAYLLTLPITRREYVFEKYIYGFLTIVAGWGFGFIICVVKFTAERQSIDWASWMAECGIILAAAILVTAVIIPVQIKYGSEKGRLVIAVAILVVFVILIVAGDKLMEGIDVHIMGIREFLREMPVNIIVLGAGIIWLLFILISFAASVKIMEDKQM